MKVSIITICYNPGPAIQTAIESVVSQSHPSIDYIIVDGGSSDGTPDMLETLADGAGFESKGSTLRFRSEPDEGLYDALNKGIRLATGDVIGFVHADDLLASPDIIATVVKTFEERGADGVYGDLVYVRECEGAKVRRCEGGGKGVHGLTRMSTDEGKAGGAEDLVPDAFKTIRYWKSGEYDPSSLKFGWMPPHPTLFLKREVYDKAVLPNGEYFDTAFTIAGDYDFMMRILGKHTISVHYLPEVMVKMRVGGASNKSLKNLIRKSKEDYIAMRRNNVGGVFTLLIKNLRKIPQFFAKA